MADNISSASTSNVVPAAQHSKAVAALLAAEAAGDSVRHRKKY